MISTQESGGGRRRFASATSVARHILTDSIQKTVEKTHPGATIVPLIISSNKTQLTVFGNKTAYPVYLTIGNLPKEIRRKPSRRGQILLAYLPTTSLEHIKNKSARRRAVANLFHACLKRILAPLEDAGRNGVPLTSADGKTRRCHPILAVYVGDYPEQLLVTCRKTGDCPKCPALRAELGEATLPHGTHLRDIEKIYENIFPARDEGPAAFTKACNAERMRPIVEPFWENLPYINIFAVITPDILHQLYQGVIMLKRGDSNVSVAEGNRTRQYPGEAPGKDL